jgi:hypothetical protein
VIGDINIFGVFLPTALVLMLLAYLVYLPLQKLLNALHVYRLVWQRALFNIAMYAALLGTLEHFSRILMQS